METMRPEKMRMETADMAAENIAKIEALFPHVVSERKSKDGSLTKAINFELLKQEISALTNNYFCLHALSQSYADAFGCHMKLSMEKNKEYPELHGIWKISSFNFLKIMGTLHHGR